MLNEARRGFLPMVFGTAAVAGARTDWAATAPDSHLWIVADTPDGSCLLGLRKAGTALWFDLIVPGDWQRRHEILAQTLRALSAWLVDQQAFQYLYGKLDADDAPPTLLPSYLSAFERAGFNTEHRMMMQRPPADLPPDHLNMPAAFSAETFSPDLLDELSTLLSEVYSAQGVDFSVEDAREEIDGASQDPLFQRSNKLIRQQGQLVAAGWAVGSDTPYMGEFVVRADLQGQGLGRYLFDRALREATSRFPDAPIQLCTCREWHRARRLYEAYGFEPTSMWTYISLNRELATHEST